MADSRHTSGAPWRNFYGRRKGKGLRPSQQRALEDQLAALSPGAVDWDANPGRHALDVGALFPARDLWLEIGFGGGEHMVHQATLHPEVGLIGCEP
ncbi:MAG: tRNA (guanosine(46)-N7)-methyltransferase TrmB, partial [Pseudomonadota bacterium]